MGWFQRLFGVWGAGSDERPAPRRAFETGGDRYSGVTLREGDRDDQRIWNGARQSEDFGRPVATLQRDLIDIGCLSGAADGRFGPMTEMAVRRFQWNRGAIDQRIGGDGALEPVALDPRMTVDGVVGPMTRASLGEWAARGARTTGSLRLTPIRSFSNFSDQGSLRPVKPGLGSRSVMVVHAGFLDSLAKVNEAAAATNVVLRFNSVFRLTGEPVTGAVVTPSQRSQHFLGNAIDWNIRYRGQVILSVQMRNFAALPQDVRSFLERVQAAGLRWGGVFTPSDPIHIDDFIDPRREPTRTVYDMLYYFNQTSVIRDHPIAEQSGS